MSDPIEQPRRHFLRDGALLFAAAELTLMSSAHGQSRERRKVVPELRPVTNTGFASMQQIEAGILNVGYAEAGPKGGPVVLLLHGWPYDIHSFVDVMPLLAGLGYRVIAPHLRGHGSTRFLSAGSLRNGQQAAVALDIVTLMDALEIETAILAGYD